MGGTFPTVIVLKSNNKSLIINNDAVKKVPSNMDEGDCDTKYDAGGMMQGYCKKGEVT